jgi:hypothetical protein
MSEAKATAKLPTHWTFEEMPDIELIGAFRVPEITALADRMATYGEVRDLEVACMEHLNRVVNAHDSLLARNRRLAKALELFERYFPGTAEEVMLTIAEDGSTLTYVQDVVRQTLAENKEQAE